MSSSTPRFMAPLKRHVVAKSPLAPTATRTPTPPRSRAAGTGAGAGASSPIVPSRSYPTESVEARLLALVHHFYVHQGASKWSSQLEQLSRHHARDRFLSAPDAQLLGTVREKAHALMRNIETLMTEATLDGVAVDSGALRTVSHTWDAAESFLRQVEALQSRIETKAEQHQQHVNRFAPSCGLSRAPSPSSTWPRALPQTPLSAIRLAHRERSVRSVTPPSTTRAVRGGSSDATVIMTTPAKGSATPRRDECASDAAGHMLTPPSSGGMRSPFGASVLRCSSTALPTPASTAYRGSLSKASEELPLHARKELLEVIESIGFDVVATGAMRDADCSEAKRCFVVLYGAADGHRRFQRWCDDQTLKAMRHR